MATKLTKYKYSLLTKGMCLLFSVIFFFSFIFNTATIIMASEIYGFEEYFGNTIPEFYSSQGFNTKLTTDLYHLREISIGNADTVANVFEANKDTVVDTAVNVYLNKKAEIIKNELKYAVENYDESYFNYEYTADAVDIPEPVTSQTNSEPLTDKNGKPIPRNVETAKKILESCEGLEFLDYSILVRQSAFTETEFHYSYTLNISPNYGYYIINFSNTDGYNLGRNEIKTLFLSQYLDVNSTEVNNAESHYYNSVDVLENLKVLKYFIIDDAGNSLTNEENATETKFINSYSSSPVYLCLDESGFRHSTLSERMKNVATDALSDIKGCRIYVYIDEDLLYNTKDTYSFMYSAYMNMLDNPATETITYSAVSLLLSLVFFVVLLCLCGHKNNIVHCTLTFIDKLPTDVHMVISLGSIAFLTYIGIFISILALESTSEAYNKLYYIYGPTFIATYFTIVFLIFGEWLTSTVRIIKSGQKYTANMLIRKLFSVIKKILRRILSGIKKSFSVFRYRPKKMQKSIIWLTAGYFSVNSILSISIYVLTMHIYEPMLAIIAVVLFIAFNCVCIILLSEYFINLDKIIDASCRHESVNFNNKNIPESLNILASNLTNTKDALDEAIEKAVRDEQMKTELITNVSHDLKTPLTSLISYSDLLNNCNIEDETAKKYIGVIHNQSIKLKRLIEDLIEASKVSSGNVTINASMLNLSELAIQVIAEFSPEIEKNGNEIIFNEPETPPSVFADGSKTYRILSNLLSNAKKYSATGTRIYISVYKENDNSVFEIKNISSEPLNISPEELTERFVRGDKSRSKDGNGLGLSIAKDLCILQSGNLELSIDGDLFKAKVILPTEEK